MPTQTRQFFVFLLDLFGAHNILSELSSEAMRQILNIKGSTWRIIPVSFHGVHLNTFHPIYYGEYHFGIQHVICFRV